MKCPGGGGKLDTQALLDEFEKLDRKDAYLLIAGKSSDDMLSSKIADAAKRSSHIIFYSGFVADEDVASYFQVSDVVSLSFKAITTSGSALLAPTFQNPLIAPSTGALLDIPKDEGFFYDPSDTQGA